MVERSENDKLKVFISYSRADLAFADQLDMALKACGYAPTLDRHGIGGGEDWRDRLSALIQEADTVAYVLSPESATSDIVQWELEETDRWGKRLIPVVCRALGETAPPQRLKDLNYVHFYAEPKVPGSGFGHGLGQLMTALDTDVDWVCRHTRLGALAARWDEGRRSVERLLTGNDIAEAKDWTARKPKGGPDVTALQLAFIRASEDGAIDRQNAAKRELEERERILQTAEADRRAREVALNDREVAIAHTARLKRLQAVAAGITLAIFAAFAWWGYGSWAQQRAIAQEAVREDIRGQIVAYATAQGEFAGDQAEGHLTSPYTTPLVAKLRQRDKAMAEALIDTHQGVTDLAIKTMGKDNPQRPLFSTSMNGHVYLWKQPPSRRKHALLIGVDNADYGPSTLILGAPSHDAKAMMQVLVEAGFDKSEITLLSNVTAREVRQQLISIEAKLRSTEPTQSRIRGKTGLMMPPPLSVPVGITKWSPPANSLLLVFFSGHGVSLNNTNYILPRIGESIDLSRPSDFERLASLSLRVEQFLSEIDNAAAASVVILDTHFPALDRPMR